MSTVVTQARAILYYMSCSVALHKVTSKDDTLKGVICRRPVMSKALALACVLVVLLAGSAYGAGTRTPFHTQECSLVSAIHLNALHDGCELCLR